MASGPNVGANLSQLDLLIKQAANDGAKVVLLPENFACINTDKEILNVAEEYGEGIIQDFLAKTARQNAIWLVAGGLPIKQENQEKVRQALLVYDDQGAVQARYDKIHLFDVLIEESGESHHESSTFDPGDQVVVVETPYGTLGLSICYDLRFPELYRQLVDQGAEILLVPSAFTKITGFAHWDALIRARAIENLAFVVAAAQGGYHYNGRETYGHSMIVDPWGRILAQQPQGTGVILANVDLGRLQQTRKNFPVLSHKKLS